MGRKESNLTNKSQVTITVIILPAHPASFAHCYVSGMQSFCFSESHDAMVWQTCYEKYCSGLEVCSWTH